MSKPPSGFWWRKDSVTGAKVLHPKMTLEVGTPPPHDESTIFRCVFCDARGTAKELQRRFCKDPNAYHGGDLKPAAPSGAIFE